MCPIFAQRVRYAKNWRAWRVVRVGACKRSERELAENGRDETVVYDATAAAGVSLCAAAAGVSLSLGAVSMLLDAATE